MKSLLALLVLWSSFSIVESAQGQPCELPIEIPIEIHDASGAQVRLKSRPKRIVTLAPSLGELVADFSGADFGRIVGVSEFTDYPPALKKKKSIGPYHRFSLESVVSLKPDLVLATHDGNSKDQVLHLRELGIPVVVVASGDFAEVESSMRLVAKAIGLPKEGERMAQRFREGLEHLSLRARQQRQRKGSPRVLLQLSERPLVVAGGKSFLHSALEALGAVNVYGEMASRYPQPSIEDAVSRDPDVIVALSMGDPALMLWKSFPQMKAVKESRLRTVAADSLARPTLRLLEGLALLEKAIYEK